MTVAADACPRLSRGVKLQFDKTREQWILQAPERIFVLDEPSYEILLRCNGITTVDDLVQDLCQAFDAAESEIAADVQELLASLIEKGIVVA